VGGAGTVEASVFRGFGYGALGHLHRPQEAGDGSLRYSGSLLKYSFDEAAHRKSVAIVEMDAAGRCAVEEVALAPRRDVRRVEGTLDELLRRAESDPGKDDYLEVSILGRDAILDPLAQLRKAYPNVLSLRRPDLEQAAALAAGRLDLERITEEDLFASFFQQASGAPLSPDERAALLSVLESLRQSSEVTA
jgi:exonuclease SbcD